MKLVYPLLFLIFSGRLHAQSVNGIVSKINSATSTIAVPLGYSIATAFFIIGVILGIMGKQRGNYMVEQSIAAVVMLSVGATLLAALKSVF